MTAKRLPTENRPVCPERLESWKEIAAYFKRGVRTVRRWEKEEGLPVHRHVHNKLATVYAHRPELDAWWGVGRGGAVSTPVMVAVLPFRNLSSDPQQDYFSDGLTEEMISQLGRLQPDSLSVIARTTVMQYKVSVKTAREIAAELRVNYLLEGSVRIEGDRARVTARLIDARNQTTLWTASHEEPLRGILVLQRELAANIGREIRLKLSPQALPHAPRDVDPAGYRWHLKGRHFLNSFTPASVRESLACFRKAIESDPAQASFYASLAEAYERLPMWSNTSARQTFPLALDAATKALEFDPTLPDAYASLGLIHANYLWDWAHAERFFQRALELNPGCSAARQWYAEFLAEMGRTDEALLTIEPARVSDPLSSAIQSTRAFALLLARRFDEAILQAEQVLEVDPQYPMALLRLGLAYSGKGRHDDAIRVFEAAEKSAAGLLDCIALQGYAHGQIGNRRKALKTLRTLKDLANTRHVPPFLLAVVFVGLGDSEEAVRCMEEEYDDRGWYLLLIKEAHQFDPLRAVPRFQALQRRMAFPQ